MVQMEQNNICINIGANNGSVKVWTNKKTLRLPYVYIGRCKVKVKLFLSRSWKPVAVVKQTCSLFPTPTALSRLLITRHAQILRFSPRITFQMAFHICDHAVWIRFDRITVLPIHDDKSHHISANTWRQIAS
jgi:hypothetical protein